MNKHLSVIRFLVGASLLFTAARASLAQIPIESKPETWKVYSSSDGRFSIYFPGNPAVTSDTLKAPIGEFVVHKHMVQTRATYGVIYADYPTQFESEAAARNFLNNAAKAASGEVGSEMLTNTELTFDGNPGRLLKERLGGGAILRAKIVLVGQRLYQIAVTSPRPENITADEVALFEKAADQFLESFKLAKDSKPAAEKALGEVDAWFEKNSGSEPVYGACITAICDPTETDNNVDGGRLSVLPKPAYPILARRANASGTVKVQVIIDEKGDVIAAQAINGHPLLYSASVAAAREAKFTPARYKGTPAKVIGIIEFNFVAGSPN